MGKLRVADRALLVEAFGQHDGFQTCWYCGTRTSSDIKLRLSQDIGKDLSARQLRTLLAKTPHEAIDPALSFVDGERWRMCRSEECDDMQRHDAVMTEYPPESVAAMVAVLDNLISNGGGK